jgi:lysophospholipid acyltransferase (LPLAT)-like uncharacterized protein
VREKLLGFPIFLLVGLWRATLRLRLVGKEHWDAVTASGKPLLFALWHQRMLPPILLRACKGDVTMASKSRDGDLIAGSKPGLILLAEALEAPVLPVGASSTRPRFLSSWDRFMVPLPFSRCVIFTEPPVARAEGESDESWLRRVDEAIDRATDEADRLCGVVNAPRGREADPAALQVAEESDG